MKSAETIKQDFPILNARKPGWVFLDNASTSQKPEAVLQRLDRFYREENANVHRGVYALSEAATQAYEDAREEAQRFLNAKSPREIIFTRGTTESLNLLAHSLCSWLLKPGDEILLTMLEHHANIVPWQMQAEKLGATVRFAPLTKDYQLDLDQVRRLISKRTKIFAFTHVSNVLGVVNSVRELTKLAHEVGAVSVVDGAQAAQHMRVDVQELGCDFYAFSGHKTLGPTGIGVLYGREELLNGMPVFHGGGDMIEKVTIYGFTHKKAPQKFEAGTPPIAQAVGLATALRYLRQYGEEELWFHDRRLGRLLWERLRDNHPRVQVLSPNIDQWVGIVTFTHRDIHPHDLAAICDGDRVCIRAGHHCAQPLMACFDVTATSRVSPYLYNSEDDINAFLESLAKAEKLFGV